jgi:phosphatidate phosphatase APP1
VRAGGAEREVLADEEGHVAARLVLDAPLPEDRIWHAVEYRLVWPVAVDAPATAVGRVLVPATTAGYGVISDIDDTVIQMDVRQLVRMARTVVFGNARTRLPFPGVAAFYRALEAGYGGVGPNPLFYVSSSPWNLHDLLAEFFELQRIPAGPALLRDWGIQAHELLPTAHGSHKQAAIRRILAEYPALPFILVGDSGQEDPEIYASIIREYPGRVLATYIRSVHRAPERIAAVAALARELEHEGATLVVADDTLAAARHAASKGWIVEDAVERVAADVDDAQPAAED